MFVMAVTTEGAAVAFTLAVHHILGVAESLPEAKLLHHSFVIMTCLSGIISLTAWPVALKTEVGNPSLTPTLQDDQFSISLVQICLVSINRESHGARPATADVAPKMPLLHNHLTPAIR